MQVLIQTWVNGAPTVVRTIEVADRDEGMQTLWNIGHSRDYNVNYCAYLMDGDRRLATLDIFPGDRWGIRKEKG